MLGLLAFASRIAQIPGIKKRKFHVRVTKEMKENFAVWLSFMEQHNGISLWQSEFVQAREVSCLGTWPVHVVSEHFVRVNDVQVPAICHG